MNIRYTLLNVLLLTGFIAGCGGDNNNSNVTVPTPTPAPAEQSVVDVAVAAGNFTTLVAALEATGLDDTLDDLSTDYTVFAPTDDAFALLGEDTINALLADTDTLSDILLYHVIAGAEVDSTAAVGSAGSKVEMANGDSTGLSLSGTDLYVNLSQVTVTDVQADNGVIHVIDAVLMPPAEPGMLTDSIADIAVANGNFTTLVAALQEADLVSTLDDDSASFTVFAPTDDAFALLGEENIQALLADADALNAVLLQHVVPGVVDSVTAYTLNGTTAETASGAEIGISIADGELMVGGATVVTKDIYASNGVIHVIDMVIVGDVELPAPPQSVVDVASDAGGFTTLLAALEATGLDSVLDDDAATFTVFAPTDEAFAALGEDTINALLADTDTLSDILLYHVISGSAVLADSAVALASSDDPFATTANEDDAALSIGSDDSLLINLSKVTSANVMADNGVIHVIDKVMMPPADAATPVNNIVETAIAAGNFQTLVSALQAASLDSVLADETETFTVFAPTDEAFDKIDEAALSALIADVPALTDVLLQHVIIGSAVDSVTAMSLNGTSVNTAADEDVAIEIVDGVLYVQGAAITTFDVQTTNGVIHVIDRVITETLE